MMRSNSHHPYMVSPPEDTQAPEEEKDEGSITPVLFPTTTKVVIVGAGASGLATGHALITKYGLPPSDLVIVEARDRIGGRIHTVDFKPADDNDDVAAFPLDLGAAWLHGTGFDWQSSSSCVSSENNQKHTTSSNNSPTWDQILSQSRPMVNPMMELLLSISQSTNSNNTSTTTDEDSPSRNMDRYLNPVFHGNPWMRPKTILHGHHRLGIFVAGRSFYSDASSSSSNEKDEEDLSASSIIIERALQRHFALLRQIHGIATQYFEQGNGLQTTSISVAEVIQTITQQKQQQYRMLEDNNNNIHDIHPDLNHNDDALYIEALMPFYFHLIECWYGCSASELRLCEFLQNDNNDDETYTEEGDFYGPHCTMKHGMQCLLQPLLACDPQRPHSPKQPPPPSRLRLEPRIFLNRPVTQIVRNQDHTITVHINSSSGSESPSTTNHSSITAECCVVTFPAGCLKAQHPTLFVPSLSIKKQEAISMTKMGSYKKIFFTFDRIFWPPQPAFLGMVRRLSKPNNPYGEDTDPLGNCLLFDNLWASRGIPCIEAVLFGNAGNWATHRADKDIRDAVLNFMQDAMGRNDSLHEYCQHCHVTRWEEDPYSRGAYSSVALNALERHVEELRRPEWDGKLIFAGEATISEFEGSVHAALLSGRNAAEKVSDILTQNKKINNSTENYV
jgi:monoamine oxidase